MCYQLDRLFLIVDCEWGSWEDWLGCTATCGGGAELRTRRARFSSDSLSCKGSFIEQQICNAQSCPEFSTLKVDVANLKTDGRYIGHFKIIKLGDHTLGFL